MFKPAIKTLLAPALAAALAALAPSGASAASADFGSYSVTYDDTTFLGGISSSFSGGGGSVGFSWSFPTASLASVANFSPADPAANSTQPYALPNFTIQANSGYALSGAVSGLLGNLNYSEFLGSTSLTFAATVSIDNGPSTPFSITFGKTATNGVNGFYSGTGSVPAGTFSSLVFAGATLTASASTGPGVGFASLTSQPQNQFTIGFIATSVPEPESYLMFLAGIGLIGSITRRRVRRAA